MSRAPLTLVACLALAACGSTAPAGPQLSEEERFAQYMEQNQPGDEHGIFNGMAGNFSAKVQSWSAPDAPPEVYQGLTNNRLILGGRFLESSFRMNMGEWGVMEGRGLLGYDTFGERYQSHWVDSFGTFMWPVSDGHAEDEGRTLVFEDEVYNPMYEQTVRSRSVTRIVDRHHHTFEMFEDRGDGEFRVLLIEYTRL